MDYYVNSDGHEYCGHKHKTREAAKRCNPGGKVFCYSEPPPEGSLAQYETDGEEDNRDAD